MALGDVAVEVGSTGSLEGEDAARTVYVVTRMPFAPNRWYAAHAKELPQDTFSPAAMMDLDTAFESAGEASAYCTAHNREAFVEAYWRKEDIPEVHKILMEEAAVRAAEAAGIEDVDEAPQGLVDAMFVELAAQFLEERVLPTHSIAKEVYKLGGGYSFAALEVQPRAGDED